MKILVPVTISMYVVKMIMSAVTVPLMHCFIFVAGVDYFLVESGYLEYDLDRTYEDRAYR